MIGSRRGWIGGAAALLSLGATLAAQQPAPPERPAFSFLRQNEDWSRFRPDAGSTDPLDAIKHIRLRDDDAAWLSLGGRAEARFEAWDGIGFGATDPGNSDTFVLTRLFLHSDLHLGEHVRFWVEGKTAQSTDR